MHHSGAKVHHTLVSVCASPPRARVLLPVLRDTIQPVPMFSESYVDALIALHGRITTAPAPIVAGHAVLACSPTGSLRIRFPVAAKIAFVSAGITHEVPGSPMPPGASELFTRCTSICGASLMRSTR